MRDMRSLLTDNVLIISHNGACSNDDVSVYFEVYNMGFPSRISPLHSVLSEDTCIIIFHSL